MWWQRLKLRTREDDISPLPTSAMRSSRSTSDQSQTKVPDSGRANDGIRERLVPSGLDCTSIIAAPAPAPSSAEEPSLEPNALALTPIQNQGLESPKFGNYQSLGSTGAFRLLKLHASTVPSDPISCSTMIRNLVGTQVPSTRLYLIPGGIWIEPCLFGSTASSVASHLAS